MIKQVLKYLGITAGILLAVSVLWVLLLKFVPVWYTPLMLRRSIEWKVEGHSYDLHHQWRSLDQISPNMVTAVIASEDGRFLKHHGFDWKGIQLAYKNNQQGKKLRGGSTISQQVAKNVFTFCSRTYARKAIEAYYTVLIEWIWGKQRIMEVYLNVVEQGRHVYGVEAASYYYFGHSSARLTNYEAAVMTALLPSPRYYKPTGPYVQRRAGKIMNLMSKTGRIQF